MTIERLRRLTQLRNQTLDVSVDDLEDKPLIAFLKRYVPDGRIKIKDVKARTEAADRVTIKGTGDCLPFVGMEVTAVFYVTPAVFIKAEGGTDWGFDHSFPVLAHSALAKLKFAPRPTLLLSSDKALESGVEKGLSFKAAVDLGRSFLGDLSFLLGSVTNTVEGAIEIIGGMPHTMLYGPINQAQATLGPVTVSNVMYELYSDAWYNTGLKQWEVRPYIGFGADLSFKRVTLTLEAEIFDPRHDILFAVNPEKGLKASLGELSHLIGETLRVPTSAINVANDVELAHLTVNLNPTGSPKVNYISVGVKTTETWTLIDNLVEIKGIELDFRVFLATPKRLDGMLSGYFDLADATIRLNAFFGTWAFSGNLTEGGLKLRKVFAYFVKTSTPAFPDLEITNLDFFVQPSTKAYSASLELEGAWKIPVTNTLHVTVEDIWFDIDHPGATSGTSFSARGAFAINSADFWLDADHAPGQGWTLKGAGVFFGSIGDLIEGIGTTFNKGVAIHVPGAFDKLRIEDLYLSFNTLSRDFTFSSDVTYGKTARLRLDLSVFSQIDGTFNHDVKGRLIFAPGTSTELDFEVALVSKKGVKDFLASYHAPSGRSHTLHDLVAAVDPGFAAAIPKGLSIDVHAALYAHHGETAPAQSKQIFAIDLAGGVNLSGLASLPLIGPVLSAAKTFKLAFTIIYPSKPFKQAELEALNQLITGGGLTFPAAADLPKELKLTTELRLGTEKIDIALPVALNRTNGTLHHDTTTHKEITSPRAKPTSDGAKWFPINKGFGPLHLQRVGFRYKGGTLTGLLDGSIALFGLDVSLMGLAVSTKLAGARKFRPKFDLHGLGLDYKNGPVELGGALLKQPGEGPYKGITEFDGLAVLRTEALSLGAIGSLAMLPDGKPSMFIYAVLEYPLGGPAFFFVTGLALGFGYNRDLHIPPIDGVKRFPLVAQAVAPADSRAKAPTDAGGAKDYVAREMRQLAKYIPPSEGEYFLAVGVRFRSFELIDSFALITVEFGRRFEVDVLGLSTLMIPPDVPAPTQPLAEAQLALKARFAPEEGVLSVQAQLTRASYVLSHQCHLTGGFAFFSWMDPNPHAGDFVVTLGGYHPDFKPPAYYPKVPRLGFNWRVNSDLALKGGMYFALVSHALMAGGELDATFKKHVDLGAASADVQAWFRIGADFLINWKPFHYQAEVYLDMSVHATIHFLGTHHVSFDAGASMHIWGPEFGGHAHAYMKVCHVKLHFDVDFGASKPERKPLPWSTFRTSFLPADDSIAGVSVKGGLIRKIKDGGKTYWVVNPKELCLVTNAVIPTKKHEAAIGLRDAQSLDGVNTTFGIAPMDKKHTEVKTTHTITVVSDDITDPKVAAKHFKLIPVRKTVPAGLWGESMKTPVNDDKRLIPDTLSGFEVVPATPFEPGHTKDISRNQLRYNTTPLDKAYKWQAVKPFTAAQKPDVSPKSHLDLWKKIEGEIVTNTKRDGLLTALGFEATVLHYGQPFHRDTVFAPHYGNVGS